MSNNMAEIQAESARIETNWKEQTRELRSETFQMLHDYTIKIATDPSVTDKYIRVLSRFGGRFSTSNNILIVAQRPGATHMIPAYKMAGKQSPGILKKNERAVYVIEPSTGKDGKTTFYKPVALADPEQFKQLLRAEDFKVEKLTMSLKGALVALLRSSPVNIKSAETVQGGAAYDHTNQVITFQRGMTATDTFRSICREVVRSLADPKRTQTSIETEALIVTRAIADKYDIPELKQQEDLAKITVYLSSLRTEDNKLDVKAIRSELEYSRETHDRLSFTMAQKMDKEAVSRCTTEKGTGSRQPSSDLCR